jgi:hypothetical protein
VRLSLRVSNAAPLITVALALTAWAPCLADNVQNVAISGTVVPITASVLTPPPPPPAAPPDVSKSERYQTGKLTSSDAEALISRVTKAASSTDCFSKTVKDKDGNPADTCVTIIHILRWGAADHSSVMFQEWYVYDPTPLKNAFYFSNAQSRFEGTVITGRTQFRFIYIHLNFNLNNSHTESFKTDITTNKDVLQYPVNYSVAITKQQTQFFKDATSLLSMIGALTTSANAASATDPEIGYVAHFPRSLRFAIHEILARGR